MRNRTRLVSSETFFLIDIAFLILLSIIILRSIAGFLFPVYFFYFVIAISAFYIFSKIDFEVVSLFSRHFYIFSIFFLILPLLIGQVTRGAVRWIPLGALSIQPAEIVRPLLLVFFANYLTKKELDLKRFGRAVFLLLVPFLLILVQPSLGVAILTLVGFFGVLLASDYPKRYLLLGFLVFLMAGPIVWKALAPYQKARVFSFIDPASDPLDSGYNSIQSMIAVGSGKFFGRGLGKGVQTQLAFLPEKQTDFIFAAVAEELGFIGTILLLIGLFFIFLWMIKAIENAESFAARAFLAGLFLSLFVQTIVHIGMNVGLMPITGIPLPLVSAGGSSLVSTMIGLGMAIGAKKKI